MHVDPSTTPFVTLLARPLPDRMHAVQETFQLTRVVSFVWPTGQARPNPGRPRCLRRPANSAVETGRRQCRPAARDAAVQRQEWAVAGAADAARLADAA